MIQVGQVVRITGCKRDVGIVTATSQNLSITEITLSGRYIPSPKSRLRQKGSPFSKFTKTIVIN